VLISTKKTKNNMSFPVNTPCENVEQFSTLSNFLMGTINEAFEEHIYFIGESKKNYSNANKVLELCDVKIQPLKKKKDEGTITEKEMEEFVKILTLGKKQIRLREGNEKCIKRYTCEALFYYALLKLNPERATKYHNDCNECYGEELEEIRQDIEDNANVVVETRTDDNEVDCLDKGEGALLKYSQAMKDFYEKRIYLLEGLQWLYEKTDYRWLLRQVADLKGGESMKVPTSLLN